MEKTKMAEKTTQRPGTKFMVRSVSKTGIKYPGSVTAQELDAELQELGVPEFYDLVHFEYTGEEASDGSSKPDTMRYSILLVKKLA